MIYWTNFSVQEWSLLTPDGWSTFLISPFQKISFPLVFSNITLIKEISNNIEIIKQIKNSITIINGIENVAEMIHSLAFDITLIKQLKTGNNKTGPFSS